MSNKIPKPKLAQKANVCTKGIKCGKTCIEHTDTCRIKASNKAIKIANKLDAARSGARFGARAGASQWDTAVRAQASGYQQWLATENAKGRLDGLLNGSAKLDGEARFTSLSTAQRKAYKDTVAEYSRALNGDSFNKLAQEAASGFAGKQPHKVMGDFLHENGSRNATYDRLLDGINDSFRDRREAQAVINEARADMHDMALRKIVEAARRKYCG